MAVLNCPECNEKVSSYANMCPHCGCPKSVIDKLLLEAEEKRQEAKRKSLEEAEKRAEELRVEKERKQIKEEQERKHEEELKKAEEEAKRKKEDIDRSESLEHITWSGIFIPRMIYGQRNTSYYDAVVCNNKEAIKYLNEKYYIEKGIRNYLNENHKFLDPEIEMYLYLLNRVKGERLKIEHIEKLIKYGKFKLSNSSNNEIFLFVYGNHTMKIKFRSGIVEILIDENKFYRFSWHKENIDRELKLLKSLDAKCEQRCVEYFEHHKHFMENRDKKTPELVYGGSNVIYSHSVERTINVSSSKCIYCGKIGPAVCNNCKDTYAKKRRPGGGYPSTDPNARGSNSNW